MSSTTSRRLQDDPAATALPQAPKSVTLVDEAGRRTLRFFASSLLWAILLAACANSSASPSSVVASRDTTASPVTTFAPGDDPSASQGALA